MAAIDAPAFQFYPKDFLTSERQIGMSAAESGIYMRLICHCWLSTTLPNSPRVLAKMAGVSDEEFSSCWHAVQECFYVNPHGRLQHARLDKERDKQDAFRAMQSEKGQKGAEKRWQRPSSGDATANTEGMPGDSSSSSSPISDLLLRSSSPISNLQSPKKEQKKSTAPPAHPAGNGNGNGHGRKPKDNLSVITKLVHTVLADLNQPQDFASLKADVKTQCAQKHIAYDADVVGRALESALAQRRHA